MFDIFEKPASGTRRVRLSIEQSSAGVVLKRQFRIDGTFRICLAAHVIIIILYCLPTVALVYFLADGPFAPFVRQNALASRQPSRVRLS